MTTQADWTIFEVCNMRNSESVKHVIVITKMPGNSTNAKGGGRTTNTLSGSSSGAGCSIVIKNIVSLAMCSQGGSTLIKSLIVGIYNKVDKSEWKTAENVY